MKLPMWEADEVETRTKALEQEVARRLTDEGADLILETDKFSKIDGYVERNGRRTSVAEVKTRTEPLAYFLERGSFLFDAAKIRNLLDVARLERLKAVVFVMTGDERLFFAQIKTMPPTEMVNARKNHHSAEYVRKLVALIPIEQFTEIQPKIHEQREDDIRFEGGRVGPDIENRYRSEEILEYYRERMAIAIEDGELPEWKAKSQAQRETEIWILDKLKWSTDKIAKKL